MGMPESYSYVLRLAELSFGSVEESIATPYTDYVVPISLAVGLAALSPPLELVPPVRDLANLQPFLDYVEAHTPNERFLAFLRQLNPPSQPGPLRDLLHRMVKADLATADHTIEPGMEFHPIQQEVFQLLRTQHAELSICSERSALRTWFHQLFASLKYEVESLGCQFLDRVQVIGATEEAESARERFAAKFHHESDVHAILPFDYSLSGVSYRRAEPEILESICELSKEADVRLHVFVLPSYDQDGGSSSCMIACLFQSSNEARSLASRKGLNLSPFGSVVPVTTLNEFIQSMERRRLTLRTVSSLVDHIRELLNCEPHVLYGVVEERSAASLVGLAKTMDHAIAVLLDLAVGKFLVLSEPEKRLCYIAPATMITAVLFHEQLESLDNLTLLKQADEIEAMGLDEGELASVIRLMVGPIHG
jgi:hypothetical protein